MQALVWEAPRSMAMRQMPDPEPLAGEVLIKVGYAGICGSEIGGYLGHNALRKPPLVMGHEFSGIIAAIGDDVAPDFHVGQKVTCNPMLACGVCFYCRAGLRQLCVSRTLIGAHRPGAFAPVVAVPADAIVPLPEMLDLRLGALVEPSAVAVRIANLAGEIAGETALVAGAGPIGLLTLQLLSQKGADTVFVSDIDPARMDMAAALGANVIDARSQDVPATVRAATGGLGAAVSIDAVGSTDTRADCVAATRSAGLVIPSGLHEEASPFPVSEVIRREVTVKGAFCYTQEEFDAGLVALEEGRLRLDPWIIEAGLEEGDHWFARLADKPGNVSKVLLIPNGDDRN